jgi:glutathione S-transferase
MLRLVQPLRLYGTVTSPYVRRVRVVARELGLTYELIDTASEVGQATLRSVSPIWKVPAAELDGALLLDSAVINEALLRRHGPGPLAAYDPSEPATRNLLTVIDGALDALINGFYLGRDGVSGASSSYLRKQQDRAASAMAWLDARVDDRWLTPARAFGVAEIALCTTIAWMEFRNTYALDGHPALRRLYAHHRDRPSLIATAPPP